MIMPVTSLLVLHKRSLRNDATTRDKKYYLLVIYEHINKFISNAKLNFL